MLSAYGFSAYLPSHSIVDIHEFAREAHDGEPPETNPSASRRPADVLDLAERGEYRGDAYGSLSSDGRHAFWSSAVSPSLAERLLNGGLNGSSSAKGSGTVAFVASLQDAALKLLRRSSAAATANARIHGVLEDIV